MQPGVIGLDKQGIQLALKMQRSGYAVTAFDSRKDHREAAATLGISTQQSLDLLAEKIPSKRVIWLMEESQNKLDEILFSLHPYLAVGDILIDGSHAFFRDTIRRAEKLQAFQIDYLDCGIIEQSGEVETIRCTLGGNKFSYLHCEKMIHDVFGEHRYLHCGRSGAGQFAAKIYSAIITGEISTAKGIETLMTSDYKNNTLPLLDFWNGLSEMKQKFTGLINALIKDALETVPGNTLEEKIRFSLGN